MPGDFPLLRQSGGVADHDRPDRNLAAESKRCAVSVGVGRVSREGKASDRERPVHRVLIRRIRR